MTQRLDCWLVSGEQSWPLETLLVRVERAGRLTRGSLTLKKPNSYSFYESAECTIVVSGITPRFEGVVIAPNPHGYFTFWSIHDNLLVWEDLQRATGLDHIKFLVEHPEHPYVLIAEGRSRGGFLLIENGERHESSSGPGEQQ